MSVMNLSWSLEPQLPVHLLASARRWSRMLVVLLLSEQLDTSGHQEPFEQRTWLLRDTFRSVVRDVVCCSWKRSWVMLPILDSVASPTAVLPWVVVRGQSTLVLRIACDSPAAWIAHGFWGKIKLGRIGFVLGCWLYFYNELILHWTFHFFDEMTSGNVILFNFVTWKFQLLIVFSIDNSAFVFCLEIATWLILPVAYACLKD